MSYEELLWFCLAAPRRRGRNHSALPVETEVSQDGPNRDQLERKHQSHNKSEETLLLPLTLTEETIINIMIYGTYLHTERKQHIKQYEI